MTVDAILPGRGASDYERYLRTDEFLALQKAPEEMNHRDELLFTTVHQTSELWLKLAAFEVDEAIAAGVDAAVRALRRAHLCLRLLTEALDMLEHMSPWEFQWGRFQRELDAKQLGVVDLYLRGREHEALYQLAEALIELDERVIVWRVRHFKTVERTIGGEVIGTQGTPVEVLGRPVHDRWFPELWDARNELTRIAGTS